MTLGLKIDVCVCVPACGLRYRCVSTGHHHTHTHNMREATAMCGVFFCGHICRLGNPIKIICVVFIAALFMDYLLLFTVAESESDD